MRAEIRHGAVRLASLGPRVLAEFLAELAGTAEAERELIEQLRRYAGLTPDLVRAVGADQFPPLPLHLVPDDLNDGGAQWRS